MDRMKKLSAFATAIKPMATATATALEIQFSVFPVLVILSASMAFLAGYTCASWQWYLSAGLALLFPLAFRHDRRAVSIAGALFLVFLAILPLAALCSMDRFSGDHTGYHLPAMRLLALGWNPWRCATPEAVAESFGIEPWDMKLLQVLFMHKGVWIFNAVAYCTHGDPLCMTLPAEWFAMAAAVLVVLNHSKSWNAGFRLLLAACLWKWGYDPISVVDAIVGIAGFALLFAMRESLSEGELPVPALFGTSFWMIAAKSSGLLACFVFWSVFSVAFLFRERRRPRKALAWIAGLGVAIALVSVAVCATPYLSSWRDYGHPLYPFATVDPEKTPTLDMIADFTATANDDLKTASAVELFCNAYVSPAATRAVHERMTGKPFAPSCRVWRNYAFFSSGKSTRTCPTTRIDRASVWATLALLVLLPGGRFMAAAAFCGLAASPGYLYGMLRYFRWFGLLLPFAAIGWSERLFSRFRTIRTLAICLGAFVFVLAVLGIPRHVIRGIDRKFDLCMTLPDDLYCNPIPPTVIPFRLQYPPAEDAAVEKGMGRHSHMSINNYKLLRRMAPGFSRIKPHPLEPADALKFHHYPLFGCYLEQDIQRPNDAERRTRLQRIRIVLFEKGPNLRRFLHQKTH